MLLSDPRVEFTLTDGSRVEMREDSELALERAEDGARIRLDRGVGIVRAAKQGKGHPRLRQGRFRRGQVAAGDRNVCHVRGGPDCAARPLPQATCRSLE